MTDSGVDLLTALFAALTVMMPHCTDMAASDGHCFHGSCPSMRPDVVLSTDRDHELTISSPTSWPRCACSSVICMVRAASVLVMVASVSVTAQYRGTAPVHQHSIRAQP